MVDLGWVEMLMAAAERYGGADGVNLPIPADEPARVPDMTRDLAGH